jgi:hypothetical protein
VDAFSKNFSFPFNLIFIPEMGGGGLVNRTELNKKNPSLWFLEFSIVANFSMNFCNSVHTPGT